MLLERSRGWDPTCLRCHVTGLGLGGWDPAHDEPLGRVTCEACHGPAGGHVAAPDAAYGRLPGGPAACVPCHTPDNSPDFRWGSYWAQVAHGR